MRRVRHSLHGLAVIAAMWLCLVSLPDAAQAPALERLKGVDELKAWFNAGVGHPRLIFLLSPT